MSQSIRPLTLKRSELPDPNLASSIERDLAIGDRNQTLANLAELSEIARRLVNNLGASRLNPPRPGLQKSFASLRLLPGARGTRSPTGRSLNDAL
jgi:hypothetical protein